MQKKLLFIWLLILLSVTIFYFIPSQDKKVKQEFDLFYSTRLSGKIVRTEEYSRGANFVLDNNPVEFTFYPYTDKHLNNGKIFQYIAEIGDSIYKPAYSDTLILIKNDRSYSYTFKKK